MPTLLEALRNYTSIDRGYHCLVHVAKMTELAKMFDLKLTDAQLLAVFFHDVVYVPGAKDNEERSAKFAVKFLREQGDVDKATIERVSQIIIDTKDHRPTIEESKAVIDLDLASLAMTWEMYVESFRGIEWEYQSTDEEEFARGRIKFLDGMMSRPNIYCGPLAVTGGMDKVAKENMAKEKEMLQKFLADKEIERSGKKDAPATEPTKPGEPDSHGFVMIGKIEMKGKDDGEKAGDDKKG